MEAKRKHNAILLRFIYLGSRSYLVEIHCILDTTRFKRIQNKILDICQKEILVEPTRKILAVLYEIIKIESNIDRLISSCWLHYTKKNLTFIRHLSWHFLSYVKLNVHQSFC